MKTNLFVSFLYRFGLLMLLAFPATCVLAQNATRSMPLGIGRDCNGVGGGTPFHSSDSVKIFSYNDVINQLSGVSACTPNLQSPSYSPYAGSIAFNPTDQMLYYIETTNGNNSFIYRWLPTTCPTSNYAYSYNYPSFIVGLDFDPLTGNGYQLEFSGSTPPYTISLRKVDFSLGTFGPTDTLLLPAGKNVYVQSGDVAFTPLGQLYFAFDNKLFEVDYSNYGPGEKLNTTYIDTLAFGAGNNLLGLSYAHGKFIASCQNGSNNVCSFKEIDISSGSAVISPITLPAGIPQYTGTDLATIISGIGVAKKVSGVSFITATSYLVQYDIKIKNYGNTTLTNVQLVDSIAKVFGPAFTSASASVVGTLPPGLALNTAYDGNTDCTIFTAGPGSTLAATLNDSAVVRVNVFLNNPGINTTYYSTTMGYAQSIFSTSISDSSNQSYSLLADLNFNSVPDDADEDIPTPLNFSIWSTLPDKVIDFGASQQGKTVVAGCSLLNTESELTINVQKSKDNMEFKTFATTGAGVYNSIVQYHWTDLYPENDKPNYYRLKFIKKDKSFFYSNVVNVSLTKALQELLISPNPFTRSVSMEFTLNSSGMITYNLINLNGKVIYSGSRTGAAGNRKIVLDDISEIPVGIYLLQINVGDEIYYKKIVKRN